MRLTSTAFADGAAIPSKYTRDGVNVSPPLAWSDVPARAKSLALVVEDPDVPDPSAPQRTWVHWIVVDLPPDVSYLAEGVARLPGGRFGRNDWDRADWGGPAPSLGRHRYIFTLYALDRPVGVAEPTKAMLESAIAGHVVEQTRLTGTYKKVRAA